MNSKKIVIATFSLLLCALIVMGTINFAIDPLFQYHKPWFGLEPYIVTPNYQASGIAKNFDFDNAAIGNSLSVNFVVSDLDSALGGKTAKLTSEGMYVFDWTFLLEIISNREEQPKKILMNMDPNFFVKESFRDSTPFQKFLCDKNYLNDVEYLFNFTLTKNYTFRSIEANKNNSVPDYDMLFMWDGGYVCGKEIALKNYYIDKEEGEWGNCVYTDSNLELLKEYFLRMENTEFIFFCSPFSVLFWCDIIERNLFAEYKEAYEKCFEFMAQFDNVSVYFWKDDEMLAIISDIENYKDAYHYGAHINKEILRRIGDNVGLLPKERERWQPLLDEYFDYLENFDYDSLFE